MRLAKVLPLLLGLLGGLPPTNGLTPLMDGARSLGQETKKKAPGQLKKNRRKSSSGLASLKDGAKKLGRTKATQRAAERADALKKKKADEKAAAKAALALRLASERCLKTYSKLVCDYWKMTTGTPDHDAFPLTGTPVPKNPLVAVSVSTFGPAELLMEQLDNFVRYTMSSTIFAVHVSANETPYGSAQAQACMRDKYPGRVVVSPVNFRSQWASPFILLSHLLNYVTLRSYGIEPKYVVFMPRNTRLFRAGLECLVTEVKISSQGTGVPSPLSREKWSSTARKEKPHEFLSMFGVKNETDVMISTSYHEGSYYPGHVMEAFVDWVSTKAGGMKTFGRLPLAMEEWYLQSWTVMHFTEMTNATTESGSFRANDNETYTISQKLIFGGTNVRKVQPYNAVVMDRHRKANCGALMEKFHTVNGSVVDDIPIFAVDYMKSCSRNYDMNRLPHFYGTNTAFVAVKRLGDHMGDYTIPMALAGPAVPKDATVQTHCAGPLWSGERITAEQYKLRMEQKVQEYGDFIASQDPYDCIHESHFYTRNKVTFPGAAVMPDSCQRILSTVSTPATFRSIIRNTTKCRASPHYFMFPEGCRGGSWDKKANKECGPIKKSVDEGKGIPSS